MSLRLLRVLIFWHSWRLNVHAATVAASAQLATYHDCMANAASGEFMRRTREADAAKKTDAILDDIARGAK
jgi:uncharacterized membrane protein YqjE